ncbi:MAG: AIR synthase family protein [Firmicutes bacterium]|nr:AIR synthase family protein [Bacillota bacterium]
MLKIGKLDSAVLQSIVIDKIKFKRPEVKTRAGVGEDCAVVDYGSYECVISTDPITASVKDVGRLAIHISCNDIASNGIEPLGITLAVLLPEGTTKEDVKEIMAQAGAAAEAVGVEIIGGHTEVTPAVNQPVIVSTAFGRGLAGESAPATEMGPGDWILMTKVAGLEGTGIIAGDKEAELEDVLTAGELAHAKELLDQVSVVKEGIAAGKVGTSGMHDVTEGGILGAIWEMCHLGGVGAEVWEKAVPVDPVTLKIAEHYGIDHLRLISSGCMLIMASDERKDAIMEAVTEAGVQISCIGRILDECEGVYLMHPNSMIEEIQPPEADELYKVV